MAALVAPGRSGLGADRLRARRKRWRRSWWKAGIGTIEKLGSDDAGGAGSDLRASAEDGRAHSGGG